MLAPALFFTGAFPVVSELPLRLPDPVVVRVEPSTLTPAEVREDERVTVRLSEPPEVMMPRRRFSTIVMLLDGSLA